MIGVAPLPGGENRPHSVKLAMLAQQVAIAENVRLNVPDAHEVQRYGGVASEHSDWAGKRSRDLSLGLSTTTGGIE